MKTSNLAKGYSDCRQPVRAFRLDTARFKAIMSIAREFDCLHQNQPSLSKLLTKIANGELIITKKS